MCVFWWGQICLTVTSSLTDSHGLMFTVLGTQVCFAHGIYQAQWDRNLWLMKISRFLIIFVFFNIIIIKINCHYKKLGVPPFCTDRHHIPEVKFWVRATIFWARAPLAEARIQCHMLTRFEITWYITPGTWKKHDVDRLCDGHIE